MRELVRARRGVALDIAERLAGRHLNEVGTFGVIGAIAAVADHGAGRIEEAVSGLDALYDRQGRGVGLRRKMRRQVFALLGVEHRVALEERDRAFGVLAFGVRVVTRDAVGIDDQLAMLALAHIAAEALRLAERHPVRRAVAVGHRGHPEHDGVDALIGNGVVA